MFGGDSALGYQTPKAFADDLFTATDGRAALPESSAHLSVAPPAPIGPQPKRLRSRLDKSLEAGQQCHSAHELHLAESRICCIGKEWHTL